MIDIYYRHVIEPVQVFASTKTSPDYMTPVNAIKLFDLKCGNNKNTYLQCTDSSLEKFLKGLFCYLFKNGFTFKRTYLKKYLSL